MRNHVKLGKIDRQHLCLNSYLFYTPLLFCFFGGMSKFSGLFRVPNNKSRNGAEHNDGVPALVSVVTLPP